MSNKSVGTAFEREFAQILSRHGFWAHCLQDNRNGQPFDIIAAKDRTAYGFDCKDCQQSIFRFSRFEENQILAMKLWKQCGNGDAFLVIRMPETGIRLMSYTRAMNLLEGGISSIAEWALKKHTYSLNAWLIAMNKL